MEKQNNPLQIVQVNERDYKKINYEGFGPPTVFGDGVTVEVRNSLAQQTKEALDYFNDEFNQWPGLAGVVKVTLKEEALAKSHRPMDLFYSKTCPIVGSLDFGELLVSATKDGLNSLRTKLLTGKSQKLVANISAIEKIEAYTSDDSISGGNLNDIITAVKKGRKLKVKLFDHQNEEKNAKLQLAFYKFAKENNVRVKKLTYGSCNDLISLVSQDERIIKKITKFIGLRTISTIPEFSVSDFHLQTSFLGSADEMLFPAPQQDVDYPIVGVIDSGICPNSSLIAPWIVARESYVPFGLEDYSHGTMVAALIVNCQSLNHQDQRFPDTHARIVDINVFPRGGTTSEDDLVSIIEEVIPKYPQVKIWNLSLGGDDPAHTTDFSDFAHFLDEMHDKYGCLFVIAAGNQNRNQYWPTTNNNSGINRISSPGDSIRALTVGSLAHKESPSAISHIDEVSPFSRIGPGPSYIPKPEITHYGGNVTAKGAFAQIGILALGPNNMLCESVGTSFATPIVSSIAAYLYHFLSQGGKVDVPTERVKALIIHSSLLNGKVTTDTINYKGFGRPGDIIDHLYCDPNCMTMVFETDINHGGFEFEKFPFPIPDCLNTEDGKYRGEILMTLVYSPEIDKNYASEYCRTNVDVGMGSYNIGKDGKRKFHSMVPAAPKDMKELYEKSRVENGFKWSPVKAYHKISPRGIDVGDWRLRLSVLRRAEMPAPNRPQKATLILTLRGLESEQPVYNETIQKINQFGWVTVDIDQHIRIRN